MSAAPENFLGCRCLSWWLIMSPRAQCGRNQVPAAVFGFARSVPWIFSNDISLLAWAFLGFCLVMSLEFFRVFGVSVVARGCLAALAPLPRVPVHYCHMSLVPVIVWLLRAPLSLLYRYPVRGLFVNLMRCAGAVILPFLSGNLVIFRQLRRYSKKGGLTKSMQSLGVSSMYSAH